MISITEMEEVADQSTFTNNTTPSRGNGGFFCGWFWPLYKERKAQREAKKAQERYEWLQREIERLQAEKENAKRRADIKAKEAEKCVLERRINELAKEINQHEADKAAGKKKLAKNEKGLKKLEALKAKEEGKKEMHEMGIALNEVKIVVKTAILQVENARLNEVEEELNQMK